MIEKTHENNTAVTIPTPLSPPSLPSPLVLQEIEIPVEDVPETPQKVRRPRKFATKSKVLPENTELTNNNITIDSNSTHNNNNNNNNNSNNNNNTSSSNNNNNTDTATNNSATTTTTTIDSTNTNQSSDVNSKQGKKKSGGKRQSMEEVSNESSAQKETPKEISLQVAKKKTALSPRPVADIVNIPIENSEEISAEYKKKKFSAKKKKKN